MSVSARRPMVAGNWKMHLNHLEAIAHAQKVAYSLSAAELTAVEVVVLPPFTDLRSVQTLIDGDNLGIGFGAQDLSAHREGAYTGDVSGPMLAKLGCGYVVVGHSERRVGHAETDADVCSKVAAAFAVDVLPILCVGEPGTVRDAGGQVGYVTAQLRAALAGLPAAQAARLVIAYEPVWAIGTGAVATPADAQEIAAALRDCLADLYTGDVADAVRLLYGGSVKPDNAREIFAAPDIDGGLIGGASLDVGAFAAICRAALPAR